jgi:hypothetical protein
MGQKIFSTVQKSADLAGKAESMNFGAEETLYASQRPKSPMLVAEMVWVTIVYISNDGDC